MHTDMIDLNDLAADYAAVLPALDPSQQRLALITYRALGEGRPVSPETLADRADVPLAEVTAYLNQRLTQQRDEQSRVVGFGGLTLTPTSHILELDGRTLYAWCALDALFLPELLGRPARIASTCPQTGETITLRVDANGVHDLAPQDAVLSLCGTERFDPGDVIASFCCLIHFFASEEAARGWTARKEGIHIVSVASGCELAGLYNRQRFAAAPLAPVVACELGSTELARQAGRWQRLAREAGLGQTESDEGLRLRFRDEPAVEETLRALVAVEAGCCAWASWDVRREERELVLVVNSTAERIASPRSSAAARLLQLASAPAPVKTRGAS